jgi:molecular chaperone GrpE
LAEDDEIPDTEYEQSEDIEALQTALAEEKEKAEKYLANWQRSQADLENYIKRSEQEKSGIVESANRMLVSDLLPILDDFERAFSAMPVELHEQNWTEGMRLIYNKIKAVLEAQGLAEIEAKGECVDPSWHEAAGQLEGEEGICVEEIRKGYRFRDKLLRPAMVMVGAGSKSKIQDESPEER